MTISSSVQAVTLFEKLLNLPIWKSEFTQDRGRIGADFRRLVGDFTRRATEPRGGPRLQRTVHFHKNSAFRAMRMVRRFLQRQDRREADVRSLERLAPFVSGFFFGR